MTDALADHCREHGVRMPAPKRMPRMPATVAFLLVLAVLMTPHEAP